MFVDYGQTVTAEIEAAQRHRRVLTDANVCRAYTSIYRPHVLARVLDWIGTALINAGQWMRSLNSESRYGRPRHHTA